MATSVGLFQARPARLVWVLISGRARLLRVRERLALAGNRNSRYALQIEETLAGSSSRRSAISTPPEFHLNPTGFPSDQHLASLRLAQFQSRAATAGEPSAGVAGTRRTAAARRTIRTPKRKGL